MPHLGSAIAADTVSRWSLSVCKNNWKIMEKYRIMKCLELIVTRCGRWTENREFIWSGLNYHMHILATYVQKHVKSFMIAIFSDLLSRIKSINSLRLLSQVTVHSHTLLNYVCDCIRTPQGGHPELWTPP